LKLIRLFKKKDLFNVPNFVLINNIEHSVNITYHNKKSSSVKVEGNILHFRMSSYLNSKNLEESYNKLLEKVTIFIKKKQPVYNNTIKDVISAKGFSFNDKYYKILLDANMKKSYYKNQCFFLKEDSESYAKNIINILIKENEEFINDYVNRINNMTYKYKIGKVELKNTISKWGHCKNDNSIMINIKLLNAPKDILNYVIIHELSHIVYKDHSKNFWKNVSIFCPDWKDIRKKLKRSSLQIYVIDDNNKTKINQ